LSPDKNNSDKDEYSIQNVSATQSKSVSKTLSTAENSKTKETIAENNLSNRSKANTNDESNLFSVSGLNVLQNSQKKINIIKTSPQQPTEATTTNLASETQTSFSGSSLISLASTVKNFAKTSLQNHDLKNIKTADRIRKNQTDTRNSDADVPPQIKNEEATISDKENNTAQEIPAASNGQNKSTPAVQTSEQSSANFEVIPHAELQRTDSKAENTPDTNVATTITEVAKQKKPFLEKIKSGLSFGIFYSPDYANRNLKKNSDYAETNSTETQSDYYSNEKPSYSFSSGLKIGYDISEKWSIAIGGVYSTYSQSSMSNSVYVQSDSVYQEQHDGHGQPPPPYGNNGGGNAGHGGGWGHNGGGHNGGGGSGSGGGQGASNEDDLHYMIHTSCGTVNIQSSPDNHDGTYYQNGDTIKASVKTEEKIEFISIPLILRFQIPKNKFTIYAETGASVNFIYKNRVKITLDDSYTETNKIDGIKKMNYSFLFSAGIQYKFAKHLQLFLEPNFRYSLSSINENNPVKTYPYFFGLKAGVVFKF
jgi:uncharacterized membrane protein YgcG